MTFSENDGIYGLIFGQSVPATMNVEGQQYVMILQKEKTYLPFAIELKDFKKVMHPGTEIAKRSIKNGVKEVAFDKGKYKYHGLIKILAEAAREAGLNF